MGFFTDDRKKRDSKLADERKITLKKEELDVSKHREKIGEVELGKEIVTEHKIVDVPVEHEEVVIERRAFNNELSDSPIIDEERIHIPVMDEFVDVGKHTEVVGEVVAHKHQIEEDKHIRESLRKEEARVHTDGDPKIVRDELDDDRGFH